MKLLIHLAITLAITLIIAGCVSAPNAPEQGTDAIVPGGNFVLCEGLWRQDNSTLTYINPTGTVIRDVVAVHDPARRLGDTGVDVAVHGDSLIVAVSVSRTLAVVDRNTGEWLGAVTTEGGREPYRLTVAGSKLYSTNINDDSITEYDLATLAVTVARVSVGPAPEGIAAAEGKLFVAISGLGDLRKDEEGASTLRILDRLDLSTVAVIKDLPNIGAVIADEKRGVVYAAYRHFASQPDSVGGVVKIDATTLEILHRYRMKNASRLALDEGTGDLYVLHEFGVERINTADETTTVIEHESAGGSDVWYSIGFDSRDGNLLIGNARSFVTDGEVIRVARDGTIVSRTPVGLNPTAFAY